VHSDMLFRIEEQRALAEACQAANLETRFVDLRCLQGHDSFLIELDSFGGPMAEFLNAP